MTSQAPFGRIVLERIHQKFRQHRDDYQQLMLVPLLITSFLNAWNAHRFYSKNLTGMSEDEVVSWQGNFTMQAEMMQPDFIRLISSMIGILLLLHFAAAIVSVTLTPLRQTTLAYYRPHTRILKLALSFMFLFLISFFPMVIANTVVATLLGGNLNIYIIFTIIAITFIYMFARLSPSLVRASLNHWMGPIEAWRFSTIKGWIMPFFSLLSMMMFVLFLVTQLSGFMLTALQGFIPLQVLLTSLTINLAFAFIAQFFSLMLILVAMVTASVAFEYGKQD